MYLDESGIQVPSIQMVTVYANTMGPSDNQNINYRDTSDYKTILDFDLMVYYFKVKKVYKKCTILCTYLELIRRFIHMTEVMTTTNMDCLVAIHQKHNHLVQVVKKLILRIPSSFSFISFIKIVMPALLLLAILF